MVDSGIILLKYWLEVEPATSRPAACESRIDDPRKIWKLSDLDLKSYSRWYDYSRARDEMFARHRHRRGRRGTSPTPTTRSAAGSTSSPTCSSQVPYEPIRRKTVTLPNRDLSEDHTEPGPRAGYIPTPF